MPRTTLRVQKTPWLKCPRRLHSRDVANGVRALLFTDIEGSTGLLQRLGPEYADLLMAYRVAVHSAVAHHSGEAHGSEGDSSFCSFPNASDAVSGAVEAQRRLSRTRWPGDLRVRVRMGIHVGEVSEVDGEPIGLAIHHAARVSTAAHGGQVILTEHARRDLLDAGAPRDVSFLDLGEHVIRDIGAVVLHQVVASGLEVSFPSPRGTSNKRSNVPAPLSSLVGRETETVEVLALLASHRLVTLTGAGGCGKTRLAMAVATASKSDVVTFVELASVVEGSQVLTAVATSLGVPSDADAVLATLSGRPSLVVLDNCEHVLSDVAAITVTILSTIASASILATSREPLRVAGEAMYRVPSLAVAAKGAPLQDVLASDAVRLFAERATLVRPDFRIRPADAEVVRVICARLDGIPLAIELAAGRSAAMSLQEVAGRLADRFRLLARPLDRRSARHQTLRATVEWSYGLLTDVEQVVLARLAVFSGGFGYEAATAVAGTGFEEYEVVDAVTGLFDKSLIDGSSTPAGMRFRFLETIRQFAVECLVTIGDLDGARERHARYFAELTAELERGAGERGFECWHSEWIENRENFRMAADWLLERDPTPALETIAGVLAVAELIGVDVPEVVPLLARCADAPALSGSAREAWAREAMLYHTAGDLSAELQFAERAERVLAIEDPPWLASAIRTDRAVLSRLLRGTSVELVEAEGLEALLDAQTPPTRALRARVLIGNQMSTLSGSPFWRRTVEMAETLGLRGIAVQHETQMLCQGILYKADLASLPRVRELNIELERQPGLLYADCLVAIVEAEFGDPHYAITLAQSRLTQLAWQGDSALQSQLLAFAAHTHLIAGVLETALDLAGEVHRVCPPSRYQPFLFNALAVTTTSGVHRRQSDAESAAQLMSRVVLRDGGVSDANARVLDEAALVALALGRTVLAQRLLSTADREQALRRHVRSPWRERQISPVRQLTGNAIPLELADVGFALQTLSQDDAVAARADG
jgi:predicted ATPase/class 3 adenylate cyclase